MLKFLDLTPEERNELFFRASSKLSISPMLLEKDFWVSWLLNQIFQQEFSQDMTFKGGTSLSKCYNYISRFSEDIDLTINKRLFTNSNVENSASRKELERTIKATDIKAVAYIQDMFKPFLEAVMKQNLGALSWQLVIDETEPKNLRFYYPSILETLENPYIKKSILIEFGVRGGIAPSEKRSVASYVESCFSDILRIQETPIQTLSPIRTFWEKVTILHAENHRRPEKVSGDRLSRHYYDVYQLIKHGVSDLAMENITLLKEVVDHKIKYFRSSWAHYEKAIPGSLSLTPNPDLLIKLATDYKQMEQMIFGKIPAFSHIIEAISIFENQINSISDTKTC